MILKCCNGTRELYRYACIGFTIGTVKSVSLGFPKWAEKSVENNISVGISTIVIAQVSTANVQIHFNFKSHYLRNDSRYK